jgi:hypothetical protein
MTELHKQGRYDRMSEDYLKLTGATPTSMADFVKLLIAPRGPRSVCARLYVVRPHQVFGAETALPRRLCRDGALHQSLGVDPVITPAYHRVRNPVTTGHIAP